MTDRDPRFAVHGGQNALRQGGIAPPADNLACRAVFLEEASVGLCVTVRSATRHRRFPEQLLPRSLPTED